MKPIWLLDIDGVLNVDSKRLWPDSKWNKFRAFGGDQRFTILIALDLADRIRKIHDSGLAEIQWHTTWQDWAYQVARGVGLPRFPICDAPEYAAWSQTKKNERWWKLPAAVRVLESERPLVWTDDDISYDNYAKPALALVRPEIPRLLICPGSAEGLGPKHLDRIEKFLEECHG